MQTPLHYAALEGYADVVLMLLEHGADPTLKTVCCVMCDIFCGKWKCDLRKWGANEVCELKCVEMDVLMCVLQTSF